MRSQNVLEEKMRKLSVGDFLVTSRGRIAVVAQIAPHDVAVLQMEEGEIEFVAFEDEKWNLADKKNIDGVTWSRYAEICREIIQHMNAVYYAESGNGN